MKKPVAFLALTLTLLAGCTTPADEDSEPSADTSSTPNEPTSSSPSDTAVADESATVAESESSEAEDPEEEESEDDRYADFITVENNDDLAALLAGPRKGPTVNEFSEKYRLKTISFDGFVVDRYINPRSADESTIDIMAGDASDPKHTGPVFQMGWYGHESQLENFKKGANVRVTAWVGMVYEFAPHQFYLVEDEDADVPAVEAR